MATDKTKNLGLNRLPTGNKSTYGRAEGTYGKGGYGGDEDTTATKKGARKIPKEDYKTTNVRVTKRRS